MSKNAIAEKRAHLLNNLLEGFVPSETVALATFTILVLEELSPQEINRIFMAVPMKDLNLIEKKWGFVKQCGEELRKLVDSTEINKKYSDQQLDPVKRFFGLFNRI